MKKYLMLLAMTAGLTATSYAQEEKDEKDEQKQKVNVPAVVKQAFLKQYPGAMASWTKEGTGYEAGFKQKGTEMSAVFDNKGMLLESETEIKSSELPAAVLEYVKSHHKGSMIKEAATITKASGEVNYEAQVKGKDLIFDASGKFLKEAKAND